MRKELAEAKAAVEKGADAGAASASASASTSASAAAPAAAASPAGGGGDPLAGKVMEGVEYSRVKSQILSAHIIFYN